MISYLGAANIFNHRAPVVSVPFRMFSSIPGLYSLEASSNPLPSPNCDSQNCLAKHLQPSTLPAPSLLEKH